MNKLKMYIAVLDEFPDYMTPTLVAHAVLGAHQKFLLDSFMNDNEEYGIWYEESFKKCVLRVNQKEFDKIAALDNVYLAHENNTLEGRKACAVVCPREEIPNVLKFAKLWTPKVVNVDFEQGYKCLLQALQMIANNSEHMDDPVKYAQVFLSMDWRNKYYIGDSIVEIKK